MSYVGALMTDRARILEERVEGLTLEIARAINQAEDPERPAIRSELTEFAISVLKEAVMLPEQSAAEPIANDASRFNPLGMGIPLVFAGSVLIFLFPPMGVVLFTVAIVMIAWGLVASAVTRH